MDGAVRRARLTLPASGSTVAEVDAAYREPGRRRLRAAAVLAVAVTAMPLVFLVPPHLPWPVLTLLAGLYFARREWVGAYEVRSFSGSCPRCGEALTVEPGTRIRNGQRLECYGCHREPELVLEASDG